jgi:20S proteasome subunit alpha 6
LFSSASRSGTAEIPEKKPATNGKTKSLEEVGGEPTILLSETQDTHEFEETTQTEEAAVVESNLMAGVDGGHDHPEEPSEGQDHLPEPPLSPSSNVHEDSSAQSPIKGKGTATPSANRLSISYAAGGRRLVVNAESVQSFKLFRHDGRAEVAIDLSKDTETGLKGVLVRYAPTS